MKRICGRCFFRLCCGGYASGGVHLPLVCMKCLSSGGLEGTLLFLFLSSFSLPLFRSLGMIAISWVFLGIAATIGCGIARLSPSRPHPRLGHNQLENSVDGIFCDYSRAFVDRCIAPEGAAEFWVCLLKYYRILSVGVLNRRFLLHLACCGRGEGRHRQGNQQEEERAEEQYGGPKKAEVVVPAEQYDRLVGGSPPYSCVSAVVPQSCPSILTALYRDTALLRPPYWESPTAV